MSWPVAYLRIVLQPHGHVRGRDQVIDSLACCDQVLAGENRSIAAGPVELVRKPAVEPDVPDGVVLRAQVAVANYHTDVCGSVGGIAVLLHWEGEGQQSHVI